MKWFKHISDSLDDPFISDLIDEFGSDGYLVFFGILEMMSREFDTKNPGKVTLSHHFIRRKLRLSWHKVSTILKYCEKEGRFFVNDSGGKININCPKLKEYCDDWTNRVLRSHSEVAPKKHRTEVEVEGEEEGKEIKELSLSKGDKGKKKEFYLTKKKRKLSGRRLETFNQFMDDFGYKNGRADAADAWLDIPSLTTTLVDTIYTAARAEKKRRPDLENRGSTPVMAQGWISGKRWEDENVKGSGGTRKPEKIDHLGRAYRILMERGEKEFKKYAEKNGMDENDTECVTERAKRIRDLGSVLKGIGN